MRKFNAQAFKMCSFPLMHSLLGRDFGCLVEGMTKARACLYAQVSPCNPAIHSLGTASLSKPFYAHAARECFEETGVKVKIKGLLEVSPSPASIHCL